MKALTLFCLTVLTAAPLASTAQTLSPAPSPAQQQAGISALLDDLASETKPYLVQEADRRWLTGRTVPRAEKIGICALDELTINAQGSVKAKEGPDPARAVIRRVRSDTRYWLAARPAPTYDAQDIECAALARTPSARSPFHTAANDFFYAPDMEAVLAARELLDVMAQRDENGVRVRCHESKCPTGIVAERLFLPASIQSVTPTDCREGARCYRVVMSASTEASEQLASNDYQTWGATFAIPPSPNGHISEVMLTRKAVLDLSGDVLD